MEIVPPCRKNEEIFCYFQINETLHKSNIFECYINSNKLIICSNDLITFWEKKESNPNQLYFLQITII